MPLISPALCIYTRDLFAMTLIVSALSVILVVVFATPSSKSAGNTILGWHDELYNTTVRCDFTHSSTISEVSAGGLIEFDRRITNTAKLAPRTRKNHRSRSWSKGKSLGTRTGIECNRRASLNRRTYLPKCLDGLPLVRRRRLRVPRDSLEDRKRNTRLRYSVVSLRRCIVLHHHDSGSEQSD